jgi:hypothetical protein
MVQDLLQADNDRIELQLQIEQNKLQEDYIKKAEELQTTTQNRIKICTDTYNMCSSNRDSLESDNIQLNKKLIKSEKQNRFFKTTTAIISTILILALL